MSAEDSFIKQEPAGRKASKAPWVLLVLVLAGAGAAGYFGLQQIQGDRAAAAAARKFADESTARAVSEFEAKKALESKLEAMAEENARMASRPKKITRAIEEPWPYNVSTT